MSTITLPNIRVGSDLQVRVRLKDGGVAIDWSTLQNIKACIYSDAQRALAGRCSISIDAEDSTLLVCNYAANKPQYLGANRVVISVKYLGETKTYDKPAFTFVRWTDDQAGEQITIDDPDVDVEIEVEDISSSILQEAVEAAFAGAERANEAAAAAEHMVDIHTGPEGKSAYEVAVEEGYTGTEEEWLASLVGPQGPQGIQGETGEAAGFGTASAALTEDGGNPGVTVATSGSDTAKNFAFTFKNLKGDKGDKGDQGNSGYTGAAGELEVVNNLTDGGSTAALSAEMGKTLDGKVSQLQQEVTADISQLETKVSLIDDENALIVSVVRTNSSGELEEVMVDISDKKEYTVTSAAGSNTFYIKFYDANNSQLGELLAFNEGTTTNITPPTNAVKLGVRSRYAFSGTITTKGEIPLINETLGEYLPIVDENNIAINGKVQTFDSTGRTDATHNTSGSTISTTSPNGNVGEKSYPVTPGQIVTVYGYGTETYRLWAFVDGVGNIIDKSAGSVNATITPQIVTVPENATILYTACYYNYINSYSVTIKNVSLSERVESLENSLSVVNVLNGKKAYFVGDSVMIGQADVDAVKNITSFIQDGFGCECHNGAAGGSVIIYPWYTGNAYSIYYQLTQVPSSADYIIIQGGLNGVNMTDPSQQNYAPMGQISQSFTDNFDKTTQIGCLEAICKYLYDNFSSKKYGFIMNYEIGSYDYWREKAELFMQVLRKWSIPVLDWRESGVSLASLPQYSKYGIDSYSLYPQYDESEGYSVDDKVIYNTYTYKANEAISAPAGAFDSSKWTLVSSQRYDTWHCNRLAYEKLAYITAKWMQTL